MGGTGNTQVVSRENPVSGASKWKNYYSITGRWRNRTFPRVRWHLKTVAVGESGLAALRAQLLKREEELRRKEQEDTERSRAEQLRKNDNAVMDSGVLRAVVTGYGEVLGMPGNVMTFAAFCFTTGTENIRLWERAGEIPHSES